MDYDLCSSHQVSSSWKCRTMREKIDYYFFFVRMMKKVNFFQLRRQKRAKVFHRRRRIADASWASKNTHYRAMMGHREVGEVIKATHLLYEKRFALYFFFTKSGGGHHNLKSSISHFSLTLPDRRRRSAEVSSISFAFSVCFLQFFRCLLFLSALLVARQQHFQSHRKAEKSRRRAHTEKKHNTHSSWVENFAVNRAKFTSSAVVRRATKLAVAAAPYRPSFSHSQYCQCCVFIFGRMISVDPKIAVLLAAPTESRVVIMSDKPSRMW